MSKDIGTLIKEELDKCNDISTVTARYEEIISEADSILKQRVSIILENGKYKFNQF